MSYFFSSIGPNSPETFLPIAERHFVGRFSSLFLLPLELVTLAGVITKIAVKALFVVPGDALINLVAYTYAYATDQEKNFKYVSAWGADKEGFDRDGRSFQQTALNIATAVKYVIIAPNRDEYGRMKVSEEIEDCRRRVFTNRESVKLEEVLTGLNQ